MNTNVEQSESPVLNWGKLVAAALVLAAGVFAFYWFGEVSWAVRTVGLVAAACVAVAIGAFTVQGRQLRHFLSESHFELRKVVWPTRQETLQTTLVIIVVVIILSIMLWLVDMFLGWVVLENLLKSG
ncbi:MAG: preprotein translocase subunit SecE [Xanthomonadaceae bacterium]|jgi:preprotein translocase subunit SecE|nr:preprotein translocase subunit SecE [Xanthomonadaceae bacterium]